jgi:hypothetical protein
MKEMTKTLLQVGHHFLLHILSFFRTFGAKTTEFEHDLRE